MSGDNARDSERNPRSGVRGVFGTAAASGQRPNPTAKRLTLGQAMSKTSGTATAGSPTPQGSAAKSGQPTPTAQAGATELDVVNGILGELQGKSPDSLESGNDDEPAEVLSTDEEEGDSPGASSEDAKEETAETGQNAEDETSEASPDEGKPQVVPLKRLNKEVGRRKALESELSTLKAEIEKLKSGNGDDDRSDAIEPWSPLKQDKEFSKAQATIRSSEAEIAAANQLLDALEDDPDGVAAKLRRFGAQLGDQPSERQMASILNGIVRRQTTALAEAKAEVKSKQSAAKAAQEQMRQQFDALSRQEYAWLEDDDDPRAQLLSNMEQHNPWVSQMPSGRFALAATAEKLHAIRLRAAKTAAAKDSKPGAGVPRVRPGGSGGGGGRAVSGDPKQAAEQRFRENPTESSLVDAIAAEL